MKQYKCPGCGKTFEQPNVPRICPICKCESTFFEEIENNEEIRKNQNIISNIKYVCPDCGKTFYEGTVPDICPNCGCPKDSFTGVGIANRQNNVAGRCNNVSSALESSNDFGAEHTANALAKIILVVGIILGIAGIIAGIIMLGDYYLRSLVVLPIIVGLLLFLVCLISWAFIKLFVNMSYRLTRLDNKFNPK